MQTRLRLFLDWGITFGEPYQTPEHGQRKVYYADRRELEAAILQKYPSPQASSAPSAIPSKAAEHPGGKYDAHRSRRTEGGGSSMRT